MKKKRKEKQEEEKAKKGKLEGGKIEVMIAKLSHLLPSLSS